MGAIVKIKAGEVRLLRKEVEKQFLTVRPDVAELRKNSFKGSYTELAECIIDRLGSRDHPMSEGLLRKLFYDSIDKETRALKPEMSFNNGFLDACYLFITDNTQNRTSYLKTRAATSGKSKPSAPPPESSGKWKKLVGISVGILAALVTAFFLIRGLLPPPEPTTQPAILVSKFVGEKEDKGELKPGEVKIAWYLRTELDAYLESALTDDIISSEKEAIEAGKDAAVKFVIWGEILGISDEFITLFTKFQIIQIPETLDLKDSEALGEMGGFRRETYPIGERGSCEFQQAFSQEWTCVALFAVGLSYYLEADYTQARHFFTQCLENCKDKTEEVSPGHVRYYLGNTAFRSSDYETATQEYQLALKHTPNDAFTHANLGSAFAERAVHSQSVPLLDSAEIHFNRALALDPTQLNLPEFLTLLNKQREAYEDIEAGRHIPGSRWNPLSTSEDEEDAEPVFTDLRNCIGELATAAPQPAPNKQAVRDDLDDMIRESKALVVQWCPGALQKKCLKKLAYAEDLLAGDNFVQTIPAIWSLYHNINAKSQREDGTPTNLECLKGISPGELAQAQQKLERISLDAALYFIFRGETFTQNKQYEKARKEYDQAIMVTSFFETSSGNLYGDETETANAADKLKSKAFLKMGYTWLLEGNEGAFCDHVQYAKYPTNTPNTRNPAWLRKYNLRNLNNILIQNPDLDLAETCCTEFYK